MWLYKALCTCCFLLTFTLPATAVPGFGNHTGWPNQVPGFGNHTGWPNGVPGFGNHTGWPNGVPGYGNRTGWLNGDKVMKCEPRLHATCKQYLFNETTKVLTFTECVDGTSSTQVELVCCILLPQSTPEGCQMPLSQAKNCSMVGVVFDILCQIKRTDAWPVSEHVTTMSLQTLPGGQETSTSKQASHRDRKKNASKGNSGLVIGLIAGLVSAILIAVIAVLVTFRVCRCKREMTEDAEKTTAAGTASKEWQAGAKPNPHNDKDDGYMDIKTLDKPEDKPQVNELDDVSMDGPYSTVKGPAMNADAGQVQKDVKPADVVMVQNEDYEGIVGGKTSGQPGEVVMVENDDYEEFVAGNGNDGAEMVENEDYERVPPGDGKSDGVAMVENENYEGIPSG